MLILYLIYSKKKKTIYLNNIYNFVIYICVKNQSYLRIKHFQVRKHTFEKLNLHPK